MSDVGVVKSQHRPVELVDVFPAESGTASDDTVDSARSGTRWPRWSWLAVAAAAVLVGGVVVQQRAHVGSSAPTRPTAPSSLAHPVRLAAPVPVRVDEVGHRLLAVPAGWDLFGRGAGVMVRIQLASGRVTRTYLPGGSATTPAALIAQPGRVVVRPAAYGVGYVVPDGAAATRLSGRLGQAGPAVVGPRPGQVWVRTSPATEDATRMTLIGPGTGAVGTSVDVPGDGYLSGDGTGHVMYTTRVNNDAFLTSPGRWQVRTSGQLVAAGANEVVTIERDHARRYSTVLTDVPSGRRHVLASRGFVSDPVLGTVAPDGRTAAILSSGASATTLALVDLSTGHRLGAGIALAGNAESLAWSPDGRWLFAATHDGVVDVVNAHSGAVHRLAVSLPPLTQLVLRPAPGG